MQETLRANALGPEWLASFEDVKLLSLDCFDTLLWRKVGEPTDVFFAMAATETFRRHGLSAAMRIEAETQARRTNWLVNGSMEVGLADIYRHALPQAGEDVIAELEECELACEIEHCFVFKPVFDLVMQARAEGASVVVVSDTYFSSAQLARLLYGVQPALQGLLDAIYCSSEYQESKGTGIWSQLLPRWDVAPAQVLHLGDNQDADLESPRRFGMRSVHFVHQDEDTAVLLRSREQAGLLLLPELRSEAPLPSHFHAQLAVCRETDPARHFGYAALGPILYAFADFIGREARRLGAGGKPVKLGFLLRDAFLPYRACAELAGAPAGSLLNISRFTAIAASLRGREQVVGLLSQMLGDNSMEQLARQLLLPAPLAAAILDEAAQARRPAAAFAERVLREETLALILEQAQAFRRRLVEHVRQATGVQPGDTLLFVDLGYAGTAQTLLKDVLKEDLGVDLQGVYLIASRATPLQGDRRGLIDAAQIDPRVIGALTGNHIAAFEMLCTRDTPSTVDYSAEGAPIYSRSAIGKPQQDKVLAIQEGCLAFIRTRRALDAGFHPRATEQGMAHQAAIDLARMLYFPTRNEVALFEEFQFDMNLGTDKRLALVDADASTAGMRRRGMGYTLTSLDKSRTNYGMELRALDLSLSSLMFSHHRFGFRIETQNVSYRQQAVKVLFQGAQMQATKELQASATYDGFFALSIPLASTRDAAVLFGADYAWVQIDSVQLVGTSEEQELREGAGLLFDQMASKGGGLYEAGPRGLMFLPRHPQYDGLACRVVFRPVARAGEEARPDLQQTRAAPIAAPAPGRVPAAAGGTEFLDAERLQQLCGAASVLHVGADDEDFARALLQRGMPVRTLAGADVGLDPSVQADCVVAEAGWLMAEDTDPDMLVRLRALTRRWLVVRFSSPQGPSRADWEGALIQAGYRRAPVAVSIEEYVTPGAAERVPQLLAFERIDDAALAGWPLDVSRESGARADTHMVRYALAASLVRSGDTVLDCGCGRGEGSAILAAQSAAAQIVGIDADPAMVAYAQASFARQYGLAFHVASPLNLAGIADDSIDLLVCFGAAGRLEDYQAFLREARRVLKPDGRIVAGAPDIDPARLRALVGAHFLVEERWAQERQGARYLARQALDAPDDGTRWQILVASNDPLTKPGTAPYRHPAFAGRALQDAGWLVDFAQHFDNPWLYRSLVQLGERIRDREVVLDLAFRVVAGARKDSADFGAALTVLAYAILEETDAPETRDVLVLIEQYLQLASDNPHVRRWQISAAYAAARLALAAGDRELAHLFFGAVERADFLVFSPLLATKAIAASFHLGSAALAEGDEARARQHFAKGVAACRKALQADDRNAIGDAQAPLSFGFSELGEVADMGAQCAMALELLPLHARSPGLFWRRVDTRRFGLVSWAQAVERENRALRERLGE